MRSLKNYKKSPSKCPQIIRFMPMMSISFSNCSKFNSKKFKATPWRKIKDSVNYLFSMPGAINIFRKNLDGCLLRSCDYSNNWGIVYIPTTDVNAQVLLWFSELKDFYFQYRLHNFYWNLCVCKIRNSEELCTILSLMISEGWMLIIATIKSISNWDPLLQAICQNMQIKQPKEHSDYLSISTKETYGLILRQ